MTFRRSPSPSLSEIDDDFTAFLESFRPGGTDKPRRRSSGEDPKVVTALGRFASWNDDGPALALVEAAQSRISELLAQMPTPSVKSAPPRKDSQGLARRSTRSLSSVLEPSPLKFEVPRPTSLLPADSNPSSRRRTSPPPKLHSTRQLTLQAPQSSPPLDLSPVKSSKPPLSSKKPSGISAASKSYANIAQTVAQMAKQSSSGRPRRPPTSSAR